MKTGVIVLNFGEPENATMEEVVPFLEKIFMMNASLEDANAVKRSKQLAEERAPSLIEEYKLIGGSPLNSQAKAEAAALETELRKRGHDVKTYVGMQFTEPSIPDAVAAARADGVERVIGLPVYPLCGYSTTVAALMDLEKAITAANWDVDVREITGWHRHPSYTQLRADAIRKVVDANGLDLNAEDIRLVFSAHGTPIKYIEEGSRYEEYVVDTCNRVSETLGATQYALGYQNHTNRPGVVWTQPDVEKVVGEIDAKKIVVDGIAFMHEQSESLAELDHDLKEDAEARGLEFYRVPIPFDDPRLAVVLADLVEPLITDRAKEAGLKQCRCRARAGTYCLNG